MQRLGGTLADLAPITGSNRKPANAAILFDWESWWASELDSHPTDQLRYRQEALNWYSAFLALGIRADVIPVTSRFEDYALVIAPVLHVVPQELANRISQYAQGGGHFVTTYFSGVVDSNDHVWLGGYPGAFRELLGIRIEEFGPLADGTGVDLDNGTTGKLWADRIDLAADNVDVLARFTGEDYDSAAAVTQRPVGRGSAAYVGTRLSPDALQPLLRTFAEAAGVEAELPAELAGAVELVLRAKGTEEFAFLINRSDAVVDVSAIPGAPLVGSGEFGSLKLGPRDVAVLRRPLS
ncbi:beta-galactosidase [Arthrobacter sp. Ld5]|uniref:beta-galactosidase n=1 Tax=Arthrobacter sp. Ld5 TaxID=649152 RepID=UPI003EB901F7